MDTVIIVETDDGTALDMRTINEGVKKVADMAGASIFMVPERLRKLNETAYTPRLFSIGPLHSHNDPHLQRPEIQNIKLSYLNALFDRLSNDPQEKDRILDRCLHEMENLKEEAKKCYADSEKANALSKEMLAIDGCFILEFLYKHCNIVMIKRDENQQQRPQKMKPIMSDEEIRNDPIFGSLVMRNSVQHDLILLENQLPFFVLQKLFQLTFPSHPHSLAEYARQYFEKVLSFHPPATSGEGDKEKNGQQATTSYRHILHLMHSCYRPSGKLKKTDHAKNSRDSASDLDFAGVKFVASGGDQFTVDFKKVGGINWLFSSPEFRIRRLAIYDSTEQILRNLIAFEQCYRGVESYVTSYAFLMDLLVNTDEDIQVLEKDEVIHNYLGARSEAKDLFNNLCKQVVLEKVYFEDTYQEATQYSRHWWPTIRAHFIRKYLATPYAFIAFVVAVIAFLIQIWQFIDKYFLKLNH